jgi:hypothetical protein
MTSILKLDTIQNENATFSISSSHFRRRTIQRLSYTHRIGWWRANNAYYWVPGAYIDFKPLRNDTRIKVSFNIPTRQYGNSQHTIQHWIFYRDEEELGRHTNGGHHTENAFTTEWDLKSWGANIYSRVGYKVRSYGEATHNAHLYLTQYWDGAGNSFNINGQTIVEEYVSAEF